MRIISFNVNGIRAVNGKGKDGKKGSDASVNLLHTLVAEQNPDVLCLQEIKTSDPKDLSSYMDILPYIKINHSKTKKGYSGVAILSKSKPINYYEDFSYAPDRFVDVKDKDFTNEGRILTAEFETCFVVTVYTVNSKDGLLRLSDRLIWDKLFRKYINILQGTKPVIVCGDLNCAHNEIDIHNPKTNRKSPGFSDEERESFSKLLRICALRDTYRALYPEKIKYTYWSNMGNARGRNVGWRIDYVLAGGGLEIISADCLNDYYGSDHCPVIADIKL